MNDKIQTFTSEDIKKLGGAKELIALAYQMMREDRMQQSELLFLYAVGLEPENEQTHFNLGVFYQTQNRLLEAQKAFSTSINIKPTAGAYNNLGLTFKHVGDLDTALKVLSMGLQLFPDDVSMYGNIANTYKAKGDSKSAVEATRHAVRLGKGNQTSIHSNIMFMMHSLDKIEPVEIYRESVLWGKKYTSAIPRFTEFSNDPDPERVLRIGYVSPDFRQHPVAHNIEPVLASHDASKVEVYCYANLKRRDHVTERFKALGHHWLEIEKMSDEDVANRIREDKIDILIDLAGHTADNRLLMFARKPAPIQISWIGYFNTTGMQTMDYFMGDARVLPPGDDSYYIEKLVRLEHLYAYQPSPAPEPGPSPYERNGYFTFGCFGALGKYSPAVMELWAQIIKAVPDSRLYLKNTGFADATVIAEYKEKFAALGVPVDRLLLVGPSPLSEYMKEYDNVDLLLDTFPYNAGATAVDGLWMGVPFITMRGPIMMSRVCAGHMQGVGLGDEFIADTREEYVRKAIDVATNRRAYLSELRMTLRPKLAATKMLQPKAYTEHLEDTYRKLWREWCAKQGAAAA